MSESNSTIDNKLNLILDQAQKLFFEFGFRNLNMDDICRSLNMSKKTLYQYVKNKEDLIEKLFTREDSRWMAASVEINNESVNAIEKLLLSSLSIYDDMKRFNPMLRFELKKYYEQVFNSYMEKVHQFIYKQLTSNILQGISEGLYRRDLDVDLTIKVYVASVVEVHNSDVCKTHDISFDKIFQVLFENLIRAISTTEGVQYFELRKIEIMQTIK